MNYIVANWKSNIDLEQTTNWLKEFDRLSKPTGFKNTILLAPPFPYLQMVQEYAQLNPNIESCGQDVSIFESGAHTGEVNATELADFCKYCIIGHSERREPQEIVIKKRDACIEAGITPIVCFVHPEQLQTYYIEHALFAWEDPQNISHDGKYQSKDPNQILQEVTKLKTDFSDAQILYGGSVNIDTAKKLAEIQQISGVLVGHASLDPKHFLDIIREFEKI